MLGLNCWENARSSHSARTKTGETMAIPHLQLVTPAIRTVLGPMAGRPLPRRRPNAELRSREYLTENEVGQLIEAAKANRYGHRDATMTLLAFRHGLRAAELCDLRCGIRSISPRPSWPSAGSREGRPAPIHSLA